MAGGLYGSICGVSVANAAEIMALDDAHYAEYMQSRFGWRVGKIKRVGMRSHYPIKRVLAECLNSKRAVLMGNAAQTIHPIGAQGFNLGLRDALCFAELISKQGLSESLTNDYATLRFSDRERTLAMSDGMARMTANNSFSSHLMRSFALSFIGSVPSIATPLVTQSMGFRSNVGVV
jgi:2-octaprenyl-6-methoxyphenol hydroxylase